MNTIRTGSDTGLDFYDYDSLGEALEVDREDDFAALELPQEDQLTGFRRERVVFYMGRAGNRCACTRCGYAETRVDPWGGFTCERCGYTNTEDREVPRRHLRRPRRIH